MKRESGVLMHISSVFGDYSIGDFGYGAKYFVDFLAECGFSYWQVLPFCPADEYNSPYKSTSAFAGNPYFISLDTLYNKNLITKYELDLQKQYTPYVCEYDRLYNERLKVLKKASSRVTDKHEIEDFILKNPHIENFCRFMAIKTNNNGKPWQKWEHEDYTTKDYFMWKFIQYEFFTQWAEIKQYANKKGIKIIGDMPLYVDADSCDVWSCRHLFKLNEKNMPVSVSGVPPDFFASSGQLWGNPIYNWDAMEKEDFLWWCDRVLHMSQMFDGIRIDHFRGIASFWEIPSDAKTAKEGKMTKGPGIKLVEKIKKSSGDSLIIAEDLGFITEDVIHLVEESGFLSMRVFQFAFSGDKNSPHLPHNYINNCISYTGTHDNNTLLGYLRELDDDTRRYVSEYCRYHKNQSESECESVIRTMFSSHAGIVIIPIQDLLEHDTAARLNTPGKAEGNWKYRITKEQLDKLDRKNLRHLNELYSRI